MTKFLIALVLTVCVLIGALLRYAPFRSVAVQRRRLLTLAYTLCTALNLLVLSLSMYLWGVECAFMYLRFGMLAYAVVMTLINILVLRGHTREHLFVFGVVITCNYLLMSIPNYLITFLPEPDIIASLFLTLLSYMALMVATYLPLRRLLCRTVEPFLQLQSQKYWNTICFIPIALFGTKFLFVGGAHNAGGVTQLISNALTGLVVIILCINISEDHERMRQQQHLEQQLTMQQLHYKQLQTRVEEARKTRHDLKHHMAAILHFVELDEKESVRDYCDELLGRVENQERIPYTGNTAADGVLFHYIQQAKEKKVDFQYLGSIRSPGIADMDLCIVLGNALDNAMTACMALPEGRRIQLVSQSQGKLLSIAIRNSFDGHVKQGERGLLSTKRANDYGVGLRSIASVCQRYGGSFETSWDASTFTALILLPLTE